MANEIEHVHQHNGKLYVGPGDDCLPLAEYIELREAAAWDAGHNSCFYVHPPQGCINPFERE
jgi:hypothetical protein